MSQGTTWAPGLGPSRPRPKWGQVGPGPLVGVRSVGSVSFSARFDFFQQTYYGNQLWFRCKQCGLHLDATFFAKGPRGTTPKIDTSDARAPLSFEEFSTVLCYFCRELYHMCDVCRALEPESAYTQSMWHHRIERGATCVNCQARSKTPCTLCGNYEIGLRTHVCSRCGISKTKASYSLSMWHHKQEDSARQILCLECEAAAPGLKCDICDQMKPTTAFSSSALNHRGDTKRKLRCVDCSKPPCMFLPMCKTCTACREEQCGGGRRCPQKITTLPTPLLPATLEAVQNYACATCRYVRCTVRQTDGSICGKERRRKAKTKAKKDKETFQCGDCQTWLLSVASMQRARRQSWLHECEE